MGAIARFGKIADFVHLGANRVFSCIINVVEQFFLTQTVADTSRMHCKHFLAPHNRYFQVHGSAGAFGSDQPKMQNFGFFLKMKNLKLVKKLLDVTNRLNQRLVMLKSCGRCFKQRTMRA